jgi:hypothetical protein|tara:strand:- start:31281 stop:31901 length:621 start_codon:yes stop_codon:yes gene_type:complete
LGYTYFIEWRPMMIDTRVNPLQSDIANFRIPVASRTALTFNALALCVIAAAALLPVALVLYWGLVDRQDILAMTGISSDALGVVTPVRRLLAAGIGIVGVAPLIWGLVRLRRCFSEFAQGRPFSARGIGGLRDFAAGIGLGIITKALSFSALTVLLSWHAPAGMRQLSVQISSDMLLMTLFAATIAALAWAMEKAAILAEENSQFV